ncbi:MAG TPA: HAD-IC family P-type ATPase, partial [Bacteroidia bacterium]|nr:HAD-IC family P-type ATPase [Bacteroidia bacterium]
LYLKNAEVIESLTRADTIVFDKTGTITESSASVMNFSGLSLTETERGLAGSLALQSNHTLSRAIAAYLRMGKSLRVEHFCEFPGKGISGEVNGFEVRLGSAEFACAKVDGKVNATCIYLSLNGVCKGYFSQTSPYRKSFPQLILSLKKKYKLAVLSGDNPGELSNLRQILGAESELRFEQSPADKLEYIKSLQSSGRHVIMVGDGLNDAGALKQSDAGIAVSDDINSFSPACDAILNSTHFSDLGLFLRFAKAGKKIIVASFVISIIYNIVGLSFAVQGSLSPVIAAILMPLSSISILLFTTGASTLAGKLFFRKRLGETDMTHHAV